MYNVNMRKLVKALFIVAITGIITVATIKRNSAEMRNLTLENIEAFAENEGGVDGKACYGAGSVDCPDGTKCEFIFVNRRLWIN